MSSECQQFGRSVADERKDEEEEEALTGQYGTPINPSPLSILSSTCTVCVLAVSAGVLRVTAELKDLSLAMAESLGRCMDPIRSFPYHPQH